MAANEPVHLHTVQQASKQHSCAVDGFEVAGARCCMIVAEWLHRWVAPSGSSCCSSITGTVGGRYAAPGASPLALS